MRIFLLSCILLTFSQITLAAEKNSLRKPQGGILEAADNIGCTVRADTTCAFHSKIQRDIDKRVRFLLNARKEKELLRFLYSGVFEKAREDLLMLYTMTVLAENILLSEKQSLLRKEYKVAWERRNQLVKELQLWRGIIILMMICAIMLMVETTK